MPCDYSKYPKDWKQIRQRILDRAGHKCERCGVANHAFGYRRADGGFYACEGMELETAGLDGEKIIRIVLTIAHTHNPDPMDCRDENLQALCQRCHNKLDAPMRAKNAAVTKSKKKMAALSAAGQMAIEGIL